MRLRKTVVAGLTGAALLAGTGVLSQPARASGPSGPSAGSAGSAGWAGSAGSAGSGAGAPVGANPLGPQVWPLGDSITYGLSPVGASSVNGQTPGGYRAPLDAALTQDGFAHLFVGTMTLNATPVLTTEGENHHDGHPGYRIDQIAADLSGTAGAGTDDGGYWMTTSPGALHPQVVIVLLGGNDILQRYDPETTFPTGNGQANYADPAQVSTFVADLTGRLQSLVGQIETYDPGSAILLCDTPPISGGSMEGQGMVDPVTGAYAQAVENLAAQEAAAGVHTGYADVWSQFVESGPQGQMVVPGLLGPDGEHPTAAGYSVIAQVLRTPLETLLSGLS
jgi:lysophospholipase L1-like esterase